jgi:hypothetical protein
VKIYSAIMGTLYPLSCLHCDMPLAFSYEVLCKECLFSLCLSEDSSVILSEDIITEEIVRALRNSPSKRIYTFVASLMILKIAKENICFETLFASAKDKVGSKLAKIISKRLKIPIAKDGLKISLLRDYVPINNLAVIDSLPRDGVIKKIGVVEN